MKLTYLIGTGYALIAAVFAALAAFFGFWLPNTATMENGILAALLAVNVVPFLLLSCDAFNE